MPLLYFVLSIVFDCAKMVGYRQPPCTVQCSIVQVHNNIRVRVLEKKVGASGQRMGCFFTELVLLLYTVRSELVLILFRACVANEQSLLLLLDKACATFLQSLLLLLDKACGASGQNIVVSLTNLVLLLYSVHCTLYRCSVAPGKTCVEELVLLL